MMVYAASLWALLASVCDPVVRVAIERCEQPSRWVRAAYVVFTLGGFGLVASFASWAAGRRRRSQWVLRWNSKTGI